jgi:hypothetical protein
MSRLGGGFLEAVFAYPIFPPGHSAPRGKSPGPLCLEHGGQVRRLDLFRWLAIIRSSVGMLWQGMALSRFGQ